MSKIFCQNNEYVSISLSNEEIVQLQKIYQTLHSEYANPRTVFEELRMTRAMELACFTNYTFQEIANTCGFSNQSAFTKAFCRYWKVTPTDARKEGEYKTELFIKRQTSLHNHHHTN